MKRVPEPQLMEEMSQARAYAAADFEEPHNRFISLFREAFSGRHIGGYALDIGCGPGDIAIRFARAFPDCVVHGVDGSPAMLACGEDILSKVGELSERVCLLREMLPGAELPRQQYDIIISNSLLHHLDDPAVLWQAVRRYAAPGAPVFVMDLMRPGSEEQARGLVEQYMEAEPEVLKRDFYRSLLAAYEVSEVRRQLEESGLGFSVSAVSDRHMLIAGESS